MRIVLIEKDCMEEETAVKALRRAFPNDTVTSFDNMKDFLAIAKDLSKDDLIITEDRFALLQITEDLEAQSAKLSEEYPHITLGYDAQKAIQKLHAHLKRINSQVPLIIFTHSVKAWIDPQILADPLVTYCEKEVSYSNLIAAINSVLTASSSK